MPYFLKKMQTGRQSRWRGRLLHERVHRWRGGVDLGGLGSRVFLLSLLVEPPHVTAEAVLVPEHLVAKLAINEGRLCAMHVPNVTGQSVPGQLLKAIRTGLLLGKTSRGRRWHTRGVSPRPRGRRGCYRYWRRILDQRCGGNRCAVMSAKHF